MIFGIRLKHYQRLLAQGENAKGNFWINRLLLKQSKKKFKTRKIEQMNVSDFVDAERFLEEYDFYNFSRILSQTFISLFFTKKYAKKNYSQRVGLVKQILKLFNFHFLTDFS